MGGDRVDAQLVLIALGDFEQGRIDALADNVLEHLSPFGFFDRHAVAQLAVHIHRQTDHALAVKQGKFQLAFQYTRIGIEEMQFDGGDGLRALHFRVDGDAIQAYRLAAVRRLNQPNGQ